MKKYLTFFVIGDDGVCELSEMAAWNTEEEALHAVRLAAGHGDHFWTVTGMQLLEIDLETNVVRDLRPKEK